MAAVIVVWSIASPPPAIPAGERPLADALTELQQQGLKIIFSDRVVLPSMRVAEGVSGSLTQRLRGLLEPHGLETRPGVSGWLIVVRAEQPEPRPEPPVVENRSEPEPKLIRVSEAMVVRPRAEVAVRVLRGGQPVKGLGADDFELFIGGERQRILAVETVDLSEIEVDRLAVDIPATARRHLVMVFDTGLEDLGSLSRGREIARRLVASGLHPTDLVGLATLSESRRPRFALGFSSDREAIDASIDIATGRTTQFVAVDPLGLRLRRSHAARQRTEPQSKSDRRLKTLETRVLGIGARLDYLEGEEELRGEEARSEHRAAVSRLMGLATSLTDLARTLRSVPGHKLVLLFSEGFDDSMLTGLGGASDIERERIHEMNLAVEGGEIWKVDPDQRYGDESAQASFEATIQEFTLGDCVIHAINTSVGEARRPRGRDGLARLALGTGGSYVPYSGDLESTLSLLRERTAVTYVIGFAPPDLDDERPGDRKLDVKLRGGVAGRVYHPEELPGPAAGEPPTLEALRLQAGRRIAAREVGGEFASSLRLEEVPTEDGRTVGVTLTVPGSVLGRAIDAGAEFYVYALTESGAVEDYFARWLPPGAAATSDGESPVGVTGQLELPPGRYSIRSLVLLRASGKSSVASAEIEL